MRSLLLIALVPLGLTGAVPASDGPDAPEEWPVPMGLYNTIYKTEQETANAIARCRENGIRLLIPSLSGGGTVLWKTDKADYHPDHRSVFDGGFDGLKSMIDHAHAAGLKVYPSVAVCPGGRMLNEHPEWETRDRAGRPSSETTTAAVSLAWPAARAAKTALLMDLVQGYEIDGILLDYCRYPENSKTPQTRYGYYGYDQPLVDACRTIYGFDPAKEAIDSPRWQLFNRMRAETVTQFVLELRESIQKSSRRIRIGGFGDTDPRLEAASCGRDWAAWGQRGLIDDFFLATYTEKAAEMPPVVRRARESLGPRVVLLSALAPFNRFLRTNEEMSEAAEAQLEAGADGLWIYREDYLNQLDLWKGAARASHLAGRRQATASRPVR
jgi:uncharacterized lipoprotein YddW (UPF0748 family)